jgi:circadian clock protein KaiC
VLLLDDRTAEGPDLQLQSIAHGVLSLDHRAPRYGPALRQLQVVKFRGSDFRSGFQDFHIRRGGLRVFPRMSAAEHGKTYVRDAVASGVPLLDQLFGGGIERGTASLLIGPPGTGKSTVALQFVAAAAQRGDHASVFTFEEARDLLLDRCDAMGIPIRQSADEGRVSVMRIDPTAVSPGQFVQMVRAAVEERGARVVVIDSLNGYINAMPEERALTVQLHELLNYLNNHGVATFLVAAQAGMMGPNMRSPVDASYLADTVVMFRLYEHEGHVKKAVSVLKKRSGRHEESVRQIWFDDTGVHLSKPLLHLRGVLVGVPVETGAMVDDTPEAPLPLVNA